MFVPIIPNNSKTKVVNKTIVYSDTVLKLNDLGENIKVTTIYGITESDFEECLKCILSSNENILFNTIQYSKKNKKIYFYTDKNIDISKWENKDIKNYERVQNQNALLEELNYIYDGENKPKDKDVIDLYTILELYKKCIKTKTKIEEIFNARIEYIMKNVLNKNCYVYGLTYYRDTKELKFKYSSLNKDKQKEIVFSKKDNDVFIVRSNTSEAPVVFNEISKIINEAYDELSNFEEVHNFYDNKYCVDVINSDLKASINMFCVSLYRKENSFKKDFEVSFSNYFDTKDIKCNSSLIIDLVKNNEIQLFKKTFVKIEDCPKWMREILYETRKQNLIEEAKNEEEKRKQELKRERINKIKKFFFPF